MAQQPPLDLSGVLARLDSTVQGTMKTMQENLTRTVDQLGNLNGLLEQFMVSALEVTLARASSGRGLALARHTAGLPVPGLVVALAGTEGSLWGPDTLPAGETIAIDFKVPEGKRSVELVCVFPSVGTGRPLEKRVTFELPAFASETVERLVESGEGELGQFAPWVVVGVKEARAILQLEEEDGLKEGDIFKVSSSKRVKVAKREKGPGSTAIHLFMSDE
jgi:hypothetical protein